MQCGTRMIRWVLPTTDSRYVESVWPLSRNLVIEKPRCEEKFSLANALCMPSSTPVFYVPSEWVVQFLGHFSTAQLWYVSSPFWEILFGLVTSPSNFEIISCMLESVDLFWSILDSTLNSALYRVMRLPFDLLALDHIGRVIFTRDEYVQSSL